MENRLVLAQLCGAYLAFRLLSVLTVVGWTRLLAERRGLYDLLKPPVGLNHLVDFVFDENSAHWTHMKVSASEAELLRLRHSYRQPTILLKVLLVGDCGYCSLWPLLSRALHRLCLGLSQRRRQWVVSGLHLEIKLASSAIITF